MSNLTPNTAPPDPSQPPMARAGFNPELVVSLGLESVGRQVDMTDRVYLDSRDSSLHYYVLCTVHKRWSASNRRSIYGDQAEG